VSMWQCKYFYSDVQWGQTIQWPKEKGQKDEQRSTQVLIGVFGVQILNSSSKILYSKFTKIFSYDLLVNDHDLHKKIFIYCLGI
jgi:hypothetical protein